MKHSRILIIDDSLTIRAMIGELLKAQGGCRHVALASDVATARKLIADFRPSLITLDLNMPGIDGLAFLDEINSSPHAPVVVVSSTTEDGSDAAKDAIKRGADACFDKRRIVTEAHAFIGMLEKTVQRRRAR